MTPPFASLLIANRGEIAVRIIRTARLLGIRTIAVFSEADAGALWTRLADEAHGIGPAPARDSYLNIDRLVEVARESGAEAVHPGYGLLSENADFARAVLDAGLIFVGPSPDAIATMGDKVAARAAAVAAGLPVLPGSDGPVSADDAPALAERIGWPVAVKASFGGGGRGMRIARGPDDLAAALEQAQRESASAFGRSEVFLERFVDGPRHVEVQVLGDAHGNAVHLGTRDCSVQRRHQKLIEEAPAPALKAGVAEAMCYAAVRLAQSVGYEGAGTVEFLLDPSGDSFFFLEMNTRLQVEHGVTELVTGIDLVEQQLRIAAEERLSLSQSDIRLNGHAVQARIAAEDAWEGFRPAGGPVTGLKLPLGPWVRNDFGVEPGDAVQPHYDSMFGKVQAWGADRETARRRLALALGELRVEGPPSTAAYLRQVLEQPDFVAVHHDTGSVERDWAPADEQRPAPTAPPPQSASGRAERVVTIPWGGQMIDVAVPGIARAGVTLADTARPGRRSGAVAGASGGGNLAAPMDGVVVSVVAQPGNVVAKGRPVLILEAMKMEVAIPAPCDGTVGAVLVAAGDTVRSGQELARMAPTA